jgi:hypothetical protein
MNAPENTTTLENKTERKRLAEFSRALMELHKALIQSEKVGYEKYFGTVQSAGQFLHLLTSDPYFAWLRPLSALIALIDETLDAREPVTTAVANAMHQEACGMLVADEEGEGFARRYFDALQRDPEVVLAHAQVTRLCGQPPKAPAA